MATDSNVRQSAEGVRTYRGRTLEEILPQIREELGADAVILREREGLVGGVGGFFAQRFIEVEARAGDGASVAGGGEAGPAQSHGGASIDIYDEEDLDPASVMDQIVAEQALLPSGDPLGDDNLDFSARRQTPGEPQEGPEPQPFAPPTVQRERIIPRQPAPPEPAPPEPAPPEPAPPAPAPSSGSFETDVFLERLRAASQILPDDDELTYPGSSASLRAAATPPAPAAEPLGEAQGDDADEDQASTPPRRPQRRPAERKPRAAQPRGAQPRRPRPAPRGTADLNPAPESTPTPAPDTTDAWATAMAALVAEPAPETDTPPRPAAPRAAAPRAAAPRPVAPSGTPQPVVTPGYESRRQRPPSLRTGLPTGPPAAGGPPAATPTPAPIAGPVAPLEMRSRREGALRGLLSRLLGGRFAASTLTRPSPPRPLDEVAAAAVASKLAARGASEGWIAQLITTAGAHGVPLADGLEAAVQAEIARRIVPAPSLPVTGAAVAFIGAGGSGKTRCTAALASAYRRASTLGVTVITIDGRGGERELKRLLQEDGVPVLSVHGEHAQRAVMAARDTGFVIVDTPTATPTDAAGIESLAASLAPLELDGIYVTLPATLGPQAARRALAGFGRLNPSAVAITHADETDQLAVVVEIAISHRIPLGYFHSGTDHLNALSSVEADALAHQLLAQ